MPTKLSMTILVTKKNYSSTNGENWRELLLVFEQMFIKFPK